MKQTRLKDLRILAIAPSSRGVGFAVVEGFGTLVDWGVKTVKKGNKNVQAITKAGELLAHYQPGVMVLEDVLTKTSRRSARIKNLSRKIISRATIWKVRVALFSKEQVRQNFLVDGLGTKHDLAEFLAKRFPQELGSRLPPKRRLWTSEDARMGIFDAVALALTWMNAPAQTKARSMKAHKRLGV